MFHKTTIAALPALTAMALLAVGCRDAVSPSPHGLGAPAFATTAGAGIALDQQNGVFGDAIPWGNGGTHVGKGFDPRNPHVGDAIVATFFWLGSSNTIVTVTDHLSDAAQTPVGNTYTLIDYVTFGGISMATYIATDVRNFPDASTATDSILAVHAIFSNSIAEGGMLISAWSGVSSVGAEALGPHSSASGAGAGTADPQWTWFFDQTPTPGNWLATVLTLNPAVTHLAFTVQPSTTLPFMPIKPAVQVTAEDDQGNPLPGFTGAVSIAIGHNGAMLIPGTLSGTRTVTAVNGVATFSDLSIDQVGNGYTLRVSAAGMAGAESAAFNVGPF